MKRIAIGAALALGVALSVACGGSAESKAPPTPQPTATLAPTATPIVSTHTRQLANDLLDSLHWFEAVIVEVIMGSDLSDVQPRLEESGGLMGQACGRALQLPSSPETSALVRACGVIMSGANRLATTGDPSSMYDAIDEARALLEPLRLEGATEP